jgi:nitrate reductase beta subunit
MGVLLYDADRIQEVASASDRDLVEAHRSIILDPNDPEVIAGAKANGIADTQIESAQRSPVYKFVKKWKLALPLHSEFRTLPMLFYVPPMLPILAKVNEDGKYDGANAFPEGLGPLLTSLESARVPVTYLASLFSAGNEEIVEDVYRKLIAVRVRQRAKQVGDVAEAEVQKAMDVGKTDVDEIEDIYRLTSLPTYDERFVVPPMAREVAVEQTMDPYTHKPSAGFGSRKAPTRRF